MKKNIFYGLSRGVAFALMLMIVSSPSPVFAKGYKFSYKFKPGQVWTAKETARIETSVMGTKSVTKTKRVVKYKVLKGPKKGWVTIKAGILSEKSSTDGSPPVSGEHYKGMVFTADIHRSGELRKYRFSGGNEQFAPYIGPVMKYGIFWMPEFPETPLSPGDEFEVIRKMEMPGGMGGEGMKSVTKSLFVLEEVSKGLAYFSVRERSVIKGSVDVKDAGKGEAVFDMKSGMWADLTLKNRSKMAAIPGIGGGGETRQVRKIVVE